MNTKKRYGMVFVATVATLVTACGMAHAAAGILKEVEDAFVRLGQEVRPCVVNIDTEGSPMEGQGRMLPPGGRERMEEFFRWFGPLIPDFDQQPPQRRMPKIMSSASGFIYDKDGHIITNNHVVEGAKTIKVRLYDEKEYDATVVGADPDTDLAVVKIDPQGRDLPVAKLGDSDKLQVGQFAIAMGSPRGFEGSLSFGHISALGRDLPLPNIRFGSFIQTDAAINFGNSGGPLCNIDGEVVGINTAIASGESLGFAIPVNRAKEIVPVLISDHKITRAYLGVGVRNVSDMAKEAGTDSVKDFIDALDLPDQTGAYVKEVKPDTPAGRAGIQLDDVIRKINGETVADSTNLVNKISNMSPGAIVEIEIWRKGKPMTVKVTLEEYAGSLRKAILGKDVLGMNVKTLTADDVEQMRLDPETRGVLIANVVEDSPADKAGIEEGDIVVSVAYRDINDERSFRNIVEEEAKPGEALLVRILRPDGQSALKVIKVPQESQP